MSTLRNRLALPRYIWTHPCNEGRRFGALASAAAFQLRSRIFKIPSVVELGGGVRIQAIPGSSPSSKFVYAKPPDWPHMAVWDHVLNPGDLFVDVGGNVGSYTLWVGRLGAEVIVAEPCHAALRQLHTNLQLNPGVNVTVLPVALSDQPGSAHFSAEDALSHLSTEDTGVQVETRTLDDIIGGRFAAGAKIDVEGGERLVLQGATEALSDQRIGLLQLEWNRASEGLLGESRYPIVELLERYNYEVVRPVSPLHFQPAAGDYGNDVFARPRQVAAW